MPTAIGISGTPFGFEFIPVPTPTPTPIPTPQPVVLRDIKRQRAEVGPAGGSTSIPTALAERFGLLDAIPINFVEPDPRTSHSGYYNNSRLNKLYVRINTSPVPVWRPVGG